MVGGVGGGGGVRVVVCGGKDLVRRRRLCLSSGEPWWGLRRSRVVIIWRGRVDGECVGSTGVLCSDVVHRTRCDTSAGGTFQRQVVVEKTCQGCARAVSVQVLYLTDRARSAHRQISPLLVAPSPPIGYRDRSQILPALCRQLCSSLLCLVAVCPALTLMSQLIPPCDHSVSLLSSYLERTSLLPRPRR